MFLFVFSSSDMDSTGEDSQNDFKERLNALLKGPDLPDPAGEYATI